MTVEAAAPPSSKRCGRSRPAAPASINIVNLPPGMYTVTFTLPGSAPSSAKGRGVINFTSNVNGEMRVGAVQETITVTGESPSSTSSPPRRPGR